MINWRAVKNKNLILIYIAGIILVLTLLGLFIVDTFTRHYIADKALVVGSRIVSDFFIPTSVSSIVFSLVALTTIIFLAYTLKTKGTTHSFHYTSYITSIVVTIIIFLANYFVTFFPYGNMFFIIISFALQIIVYGILLPYLMMASLCYIYLIFKGDVKDIFK
jgi:hypothetical protein